MPATAPATDQLTLDITEEILVRSSIASAYDALIEEIGASNRGYENAPMPMVLEAWPGGRWFRDLGGNNGHCWGHVQAIKRPTLLEINGPMMMSFAVSSNIQYRLKEVDGGTLITFHHSALGLFPPGYRDALSQGWRGIFERLRKRVEIETQ